MVTARTLHRLGLVAVMGASPLSCDRLAALRAETHVVVLDAASGVRAGDEVRIAGVRVGRVKRLEHRHAEAVVTFGVKRGSPLFADGCGIVNPKSSFGPRYLSLVPGTRASGPLGERDELYRCANAFDLPQMLDQLRPLLETKDGPTYASTVRSIKTFNGLLRLIVGDENKTPDVSATISKTDAKVAEVTTWVREHADPIEVGVRRASEALEQGVKSVLLDSIEARLIKAERELPADFDHYETQLRALEARLDEALTTEHVADRDEVIRDTVELLADIRETLDEWSVPGKDALETLDDVRAGIKRVLIYDERYFRLQVQVEGPRSYPWDPPKEARAALEKAGVAVKKAPGWRD